MASHTTLGNIDSSLCLSFVWFWHPWLSCLPSNLSSSRLVIQVHGGCSNYLSRGNRHLRKNKIFSPNLANPMFTLSGTCCPTLARKTLMCDILKFVPGVCSPVTLHSVAAALKHLRLSLRYWLTSSASSATSTPELSPLPPTFLESRHNKSTV